MVGTEVKNAKGESIGEVKEIMIDWEHGRVGYVVLSFGGFLGMGDKLFAVPIEAFDFTAHHEDGRILLNVPRERLEDAPGFDKDNWPQHPDREFQDQVYSHYGHEPYWAHEHAHQR